MRAGSIFSIVLGVFVIAVAGALLSSTESAAFDDGTKVAREAGVEERLDRQVNLDRPFVDETGKKVTLRELIVPHRPLMIIPVYYTCPRLCSLTLAGVRKLLNELDLRIGDDFTVVAVSFNSIETPETAKKRAEEYRSQLAAPARPESWRFLVGKEQEIRPTMEELGFKYIRDNGEFAHTSAFMILTPEGRISRYFYGVEHKPRDARFALVEAAQGKIGSTFDRFLLFCFDYDPRNGRYTLLTMNVARLVGSGSLAALAALIVTLRYREKKKASA